MIILPNNSNFRPYSQPRSIVKVNSVYVPFQTWDVNLNGYAAADTFDLTCPFRILDYLKGTTDLANTPTTETILLTQPDILVEIYGGYPSDPNNYNESDLTQLMYGYLDTVDFHFETSGESVQIAGRNEVGPFMDTKTTDKFPNQTSSAIVATFAAQYNLQTQITPTYTLAGTYYSDDQVQLTTDITQWDLMNYLAGQEGFTLRVVGNTLYFGPRDSFLKSTTLPYTWGQNVKRLHLQRTPHAAKDIKVEVITWQPGKKTRIVATATNATSYAKKVTGTSAHQEWVETYYFPGLTQDQAQSKANTILDQLSSSELIGDLACDGNDQQDIYQPLQLYGTGLGSDQQYWPTKVTHSFDHKQGNYGMTLNFSNLNMPATDPGGI
jgi:phage protein D